MTQEHDRIERVAQHLSRRRLIAGGATLLTAGGTLVYVGEPASAMVAVDEFTVSDASFETDSLDPVVDLSVAYAYDAGSEAVEKVRFELAVDGSVVTTEDVMTSQTSAEAETTLSGRIVDSDAWALEDFAVSVGEQVTREVSVDLSFAVIDRAGSEIVSDSASDTADIVVSHPQESALSASVGGSGTITNRNA